MGQPDRDEAGRYLLGAAIRRRRHASELTLAQLAGAAGISLSFLSDVERGRRLISLDDLDACAVALGTTVLSLLDGVYPYGASDAPDSVSATPDGRLREE